MRVITPRMCFILGLAVVAYGISVFSFYNIERVYHVPNAHQDNGTTIIDNRKNSRFEGNDSNISGFIDATMQGSNDQIKVVVKAVRSEVLGLNAQFAILKNDEYVGPTFASGGWYEDTEVAALLQVYGNRLDREKVDIVDLGGNMGAFTVGFGLHLVNKAQTGGTVYAFEPQRAMFANLAANIFINGLPNVKAYNAAVVHADGTWLSLGGKHTTGRADGKKVDITGEYLQNFGGQQIGPGGERVAGLTLDSLNLQRVALIKADMQGAEPLAFYGARETIKRNKPAIMFEKEGSETVSDEMVAALGGNVPDEARYFDVVQYCLSLGYQRKKVPGVAGRNIFLVHPTTSGVF